MAQRYRTERDGNLDPGYWDPNVGGRQGQRDESEGWVRSQPQQGRAQHERQWAMRDLERDHVQGRRPHQSSQGGGRSEDHAQTYDENAEGWRRAGGGRAAGGRHAPPDLDIDQGWHSNADWSGEGDAVPTYGRGAFRGEASARRRGGAAGNSFGQGRESSWEQSGSGWDRDSDLSARGGSRGYGAPRDAGRDFGRDDEDDGWGGRGQGARGTEGRDWSGRDWRGAEQTTGRGYFSHGHDRDDYGGYVEPERSRSSGSSGGQRQRSSPYSGSSAGYATGDAFGGDGSSTWGGSEQQGDPSFSGGFVGRGGSARDYEPDFGRGGQRQGQRAQTHRGPDHRGKGPKGYARSAERIREEVCEWLADDDLVDASEISVTCGEGGVLVLEGTVDSLQAKHRAEMIADQCTGVREVDSRLRVARPNRQMDRMQGGQASESQSSAAGQSSSGSQSSTGGMASGTAPGTAPGTASGAGATGGSETGAVGRQEQGQDKESRDKEGQGSGSATASRYGMLATPRDADKDRQKH